jgi:hypothetical protein
LEYCNETEGIDNLQDAPYMVVTHVPDKSFWLVYDPYGEDDMDDGVAVHQVQHTKFYANTKLGLKVIRLPFAMVEQNNLPPPAHRPTSQPLSEALSPENQASQCNGASDRPDDATVLLAGSYPLQNDNPPRRKASYDVKNDNFRIKRPLQTEVSAYIQNVGRGPIVDIGEPEKDSQPRGCPMTRAVNMIDIDAMDKDASSASERKG